MTKEDFCYVFDQLCATQDTLYKLEELTGINSCEGFVDDLMSTTGDFLLRTAFYGLSFPDEFYETFWNMISDECRDNKDAEKFFDSIGIWVRKNAMMPVVKEENSYV